jgi:hypothetical protein
MRTIFLFSSSLLLSSETSGYPVDQASQDKATLSMVRVSKAAIEQIIIFPWFIASSWWLARLFRGGVAASSSNCGA